MSPDLEPSLLARRSDSVISERFDAETLVLDPHHDRYVRLNETGSRLWELLEKPVLIQDLAAVLAEEWGLTPDRAREDVLAFVSSLADRGLVELTPP